MHIAIKNMVCNRCIMMVEKLFEDAGFPPVKVDLGEVILKEELNPEQLNHMKELLKPLGFYIIDNKRAKLIEKIKTTIINLVHYSDKRLKVNLSTYLSNQINYDYNYLSNLFSETEGKTIERYYIQQKIEKAKELLVYDEYTLSEIADRLDYSSVAHLSSQFKRITGLTPSHFKEIKEKKRKPLDEL